MWDPSSLTRYRTWAPCSERQSLNHWAAEEVPKFFNVIKKMMTLGYNNTLNKTPQYRHKRFMYMQHNFS